MKKLNKVNARDECCFHKKNILQKVTSFAEKSAKTSVNLLEKLSDSSANNKDILQEKQALSHSIVH